MKTILSGSWIEGVIAAANAIDDAGLILNSMLCSIERIDRLGLNHDILSGLNSYDGRARSVLTYVYISHLACGTKERMIEALRAMSKRRRFGVMTLALSELVKLGESFASLELNEIAEEFGFPILTIDGDTLEGSLPDGFSDALVTAARHIASACKPEPKKGRVSIIGYLFDRGEADCRGDVEELRSLAEKLGATVDCVWLEGKKYSELAKVANSEKIISLPCGAKAAKIFTDVWGTERLETPLPIGVEGTKEWIAKVGEFLGKPKEAKDLAEREAARCTASILPFAQKEFFGKSAVICADKHTAFPLARFMEELGFEVPLVIEHSLIRKIEKISGGIFKSGVTFAEFRDDVERLCASTLGLDAIIGSTYEREIALQSKTAFLELSYPRWVSHAVYPKPALGFNGALRVADDLFNALSAREFKKRLIRSDKARGR